MDREEIVRALTKRGIIVTPGVLERIESGMPVEEAVGQAEPPARKTPKTKLLVKIRRAEPMPRMSPEDFTSYYNNRYEGLKKLLLKRVNALSINKARESFSEVSVIGMVREKNPQGFTLEDTTGEIPVVSSDDITEDDVVGVRGVIKEGRLFQKELIWPDVPPNSGARLIPSMTLLLSTFLDENIRQAAPGFSLMIVPERPGMELTEDEKRKLITDLPNPCLATIDREGTDFSVLVYKPARQLSPQEAAGLLKKRHLSPDRGEISTRTDPFLIEPVPDLLWIISGERHFERYRGVGIIMTKENDAVKYDAGTGRVYFAYDKPAPSQAVPD
jgi:hypothetical protein